MFTETDKQIAQNTIAWYYGDQMADLVLPQDVPEVDDPYIAQPAESAGLTFSLPDGWWMMLLLGVMLNIIITLLLK